MEPRRKLAMDVMTIVSQTYPNATLLGPEYIELTRQMDNDYEAKMREWENTHPQPVTYTTEGQFLKQWRNAGRRE